MKLKRIKPKKKHKHSSEIKKAKKVWTEVFERENWLKNI